MAPFVFSDQDRLQSARRVLARVAETVNAPFSVRLWDGSMIPLGQNVTTPYFISINGSRTISSIIKKPSMENLLRHYASGRIDFEGGDLLSFGEILRKEKIKKDFRKIRKSSLWREALIFLMGPSEDISPKHIFNRGASEQRRSHRTEKDYIHFHYDLGNAFYQLFLDPEMQYSCAYFTEENQSLESAQLNKLDMTCRKLRLKPGERLLDIGSGWGGLICFAAKKFGVKAHGVTLSQEQFDFTRDKIRRSGLKDHVTVELKDYMKLEGVYDKIVSVGMYEHVGIAHYTAYFNKVNSLLRDRGVFLNHGIVRRAKASKRKFKKIRPERRLILKYIFPGTQLDHIGHTLEVLETCGFEVKDVESWREHYALTTAAWYRRLWERRQEAERLVGAERLRLWLGYLASVSFGFVDGYSNVYQTVAVKRQSKGFSGLPMTRRDLYA